MDSIESLILNAVDIVLEQKLKGLRFNYTIEATINQNLGSGKYNITNNNETFTAYSKNGSSYVIGDVVDVLIRNGDFSNKIILWKV